jgi:1,4-dihydroxy-2-naphthoate polyprenyltransferase
MSYHKIKDWIGEIRPKTLAASLSPVIIGCALAIADGKFVVGAALLCAGVAVLAQIASNLANDYFDIIHGIDGEERVGPRRAALEGRISSKAILTAAIITLGLASLCGLGLLFYATWKIILVGIVIAIGVFAYSAGPFPLSQHALGDVAVFIFYGLVPVCFTYFVQAGNFTVQTFLFATAIGVLSVNILIMNNYRDMETDREAGKITTAVLFGRRCLRIVYLINVLLASAAIIIYSQSWLAIAIAALFTLIGIGTWREIAKRKGKELNITFGHTARNVLIYAILSTIVILQRLF